MRVSSKASDEAMKRLGELCPRKTSCDNCHCYVGRFVCDCGCGHHFCCVDCAEEWHERKSVIRNGKK
jgi:hypothetical protein